MTQATHESHPSSGAELVDTDGRTLPLRGSRLGVHAGGGYARATLRQTFFNPYAEPLRVTYKLPLPADGAVAGFAFELEGQRTLGVVKPRETARHDCERALLEGRTAALLEQERTSLFTQEIGNIPPGASVDVEVSIDQPLEFDRGSWVLRYPTVVGPRYLGGPGRTPDADRVTVPVADSLEVDARVQLHLHIDDPLTGPPISPSHRIQTHRNTVRLQESGGVPLDRDLVIRWPVAQAEAGIELVAGRPGESHPGSDHAYGVLTVVPPRDVTGAVARHLVLLIDVSGSMHGRPLDQAKRVLRDLVSTLGSDDRLEMVAFASQAVRWRSEPTRMNDAERSTADAWLAGLQSSGATEMRDGIREALRGVPAEGAHQLVVVTDGYIGFEREILEDVQDLLPTNGQVHTLGVGDAVNRSLTGPLARVGGGVEQVIGLAEAPDAAARKLLEVTASPQLVGARVFGDAVVDTAARRVADAYAGSPARVPVRLRPEGGYLTLVGQAPQGTFEKTIAVPALAAGEGDGRFAALYARERVEDLEASRHVGREVDDEVERLGVDFQIATRRTSWVAVSDDPTVDPTEPTRSEVMPHALPSGISPGGVFGGGEAPLMRAMPSRLAKVMASPMALDVADGFALDLDSASLEMPSEPLGAAGASRGRSLDFEDALFDLETMADRDGAGGLTGEIVLREDDRLVVQVLLQAELDWMQPERWMLVFDDGRRAEVELDPEVTTRAAALESGVVLRVAFRGVPEGTVVEARCGGYRIELDAT